jgi:phosphatidylglycerol:prolipoprotein diacylglycerol transferase
MFPVLFEIGGFTMTTFGVMMALAFLVAGWVTAREFERTGENPEHAWDLLGYAAVFGILGAKLYYLILNWQDTLANPGAALLSRSGLVWYGGLILAALAVAWKRGRMGLPFGRTADAAGLALAAGYAVGRMGASWWATTTAAPPTCRGASPSRRAHPPPPRRTCAPSEWTCPPASLGTR